MIRIQYFFYPILLLSIIFSSCKRDIELLQKGNSPYSKTGNAGIQVMSSSTGCVEDQDNGSAYDTIPRPTLLGYRLINNPYSVGNMQTASRNLYGTSSGIIENKWYVRFKPANPQQLGILDSLDLDLFDYPLDYEVLQDGDYYNDGVTPAETIPWIYTVVAPNFVPPASIQYELLQRIHVPVLASIEREAFRITGNPVPDTTCSTGGLKPLDADDCPNGYTWDPILRQCVRNPTGPPPPTPTRLPSGTLLVFDNNIVANGRTVPVRNVRVIAKRFLKVERTFTNNQGQYNIVKEFNKVNIIVRTKTDRANIRSLRRARLWQMLFPVKVHLGKFKGPLNNLQHVVEYNANALSSGSRHWAALSVHNNVQDYYDNAVQLGIGTPPAKIKILLTNWRLQGVSGAAPMFAKRFWQLLPEAFVSYYLIANVNSVAGGFAALFQVLKFQVDVTLGYNRFGSDITAISDQLGEVAFHELTHAAHYNKVGSAWYNDFVDAEVNQLIYASNPPYGLGNAGTKSEIIALGESWAYHMGHFLSDRKYAGNSSTVFEQGFEYRNGDIRSGGVVVANTGLNAHLNLLEDFNTDRTADLDRWIPQGLYFDLIDNSNDNNTVPRRVSLNDNVANFYTNQQFFNALDSDIKSLGAFQTRLLNENANNQAPGVNQIFTFYVR